MLIPRTATGALGRPTSVIRDAHRRGLDVHAWSFRRENTLLPTNFRNGTDPAGIGDMAGELQVFLSAGVDGLFTDNPDLGAAVAHR